MDFNNKYYNEFHNLSNQVNGGRELAQMPEGPQSDRGQCTRLTVELAPTQPKRPVLLFGHVNLLNIQEKVNTNLGYTGDMEVLYRGKFIVLGDDVAHIMNDSEDWEIRAAR